MRLGVNIDHVATLRQARRGRYPDPVAAAALAELGGADQITLHVREDRRHVNDRDLEILRKTVNGTLNLEMATVQAMLDLALSQRPDTATLVPERREELTTEGGLDVGSHKDEIKRVEQISELNIGYAIVCRAVLTGLEKAVRDMKDLIG